MENSLNETGNLVVLVGPTAVGKTGLAVELARHYQTEIISADSRQFYRELSIGTAKPTAEEMQGIKHHLLDFLDLETYYNVSRFENDAIALLNVLFTQFDPVILAGGSGLYVKAICEGIDEMPDIDPEIRQKWKKRIQEKGLERRAVMLQQLDPEYAAKTDLKNPNRILRGLEMFDQTGKPFSVFHRNSKTLRLWKTIKIGLERPREELYQRINLRMDLMIGQGLFEEVEKLYPFRHLNALNTVGYKEIFGYLDQQYDREETIRLLKRNSRHYAKRQMTWFKKDAEITWFHPDQKEKIVEWIDSKLNR
jgi:tRNA dimethylallyltransferase